MTSTVGTIPAMTPYQPGALPIAGTEQVEIASSESATAAATYRLPIVELVGKAPSVMTSALPTSNDLVAFYQASSGLPKQSTIGNLGVAAGNVPTGGTAGQILEKNSSTNYDASWSNISGLVSASTGISVTGSTTVAIALASETPLSVLGVAATATAVPLPITAGGGSLVLQTNAGGTGIIWAAVATGTLPGPFQVSTLTAFGVLFGNGSSAIGATAAGTTSWPLIGNGSAIAPSFQQLNLGSSGITGFLSTSNITGVFGLVNGGVGTNVLTQNGVVFGNGTSTVGITVAGATALPLVSPGPLANPSFSVLTVPGGGIGTSILLANGLVVAQGSSAFTAIAAATAGFVLAGNGTGSIPTFQNITTLAVTLVTAGGGLSAIGVGTTGGQITGTGTLNTIHYPNIKTALYTVATGDLGTLVAFSAATIVTAIIPQATTGTASGFGPGWYVDLINFGGTSVIVAPLTSNLTGIGATALLGPAQSIRLVSDATNYQGFGLPGLSKTNLNQVFTGGIRLVSFNAGTTSGNTTITFDSGSGPIQTLTNNGTGTLTAPSNDGEIDCMVVNTTNASTLSFSGFNVGASVGDTYTTTAGTRFILSIRRISGSSTYRWASLQ